ncbi:MAG TPA: DUF305 domain-containing protein [Ilumatobacteraceae bacterium]|nr:DUF305 domain-containing protein [Ilumatobacteraceae bacterium]
MRSPTGLDDPASTSPSQPPSDGPVDQTISDEATQKLLKGVIVVMAAIVVIGLFAGAAIWALGGDDEPAAPMNAVDVGFLQDMLDHHEQALLISNLYIDNNPDGDAVPYAEEVIMFQTRDMGWMNDWLADEGYAPGEPDRIAMQWMNEPVPVAEMTGMQTPERLAELANASGADADRLFFEIMTDHHLGGVHMAEHAAANGARQEIMDFAESVARNQRIEVVEYEGAMRRLGLA